jgi:short-subunit dehydrogenase
VEPGLIRVATPLTAALVGQRAFITGGGSGIGLAFATLLARDGWHLGLLDRDDARLVPARAALLAAGARAVDSYALDVSDAAAFTAAVGDFAARAGGLEFMVNNAGVAHAGDVASTPVEDWRWAFEINLIAVATGCRAALPLLARAPAARLLNIASSAAFATAPDMGVYNASKAAVVALTETLAHELDGTGVRASVALPGFIPTRLLEGARATAALRAAAERLMRASRYPADAAARDILAAVAKGRLYIVVPASYRWLWRLKRYAPGAFARLLRRTRRQARARDR